MEKSTAPSLAGVALLPTTTTKTWRRVGGDAGGAAPRHPSVPPAPLRPSPAPLPSISLSSLRHWSRAAAAGRREAAIGGREPPLRAGPGRAGGEGEAGGGPAAMPKRSCPFGEAAPLQLKTRVGLRELSRGVRAEELRREIFGETVGL